MRTIFLCIVGVFLMASCKTTTVSQSAVHVDNDTMLFVHGKLFAATYMQRSAEFKALCFQAYNWAKVQLDNALQQKGNKPLAIVTDIDETILDNTPFEVRQSLYNKEYNQADWELWTNQASADTLCGAKSFLDYAAQKGVTIFYVTNRLTSEKEATVRNLKKFQFPFATADYVICKESISSKEPRRQNILQQFDIALYCGDNLADFSAIFDKKTEAQRTLEVRNNAAAFGTKFIVLPNPNYGDWEQALFEYKKNLSRKARASMLKKKIKSY